MRFALWSKWICAKLADVVRKTKGPDFFLFFWGKRGDSLLKITSFFCCLVEISAPANSIFSTTIRRISTGQAVCVLGCLEQPSSLSNRYVTNMLCKRHKSLNELVSHQCLKGGDFARTGYELCFFSTTAWLRLFNVSLAPICKPAEFFGHCFWKKGTIMKGFLCRKLVSSSLTLFCPVFLVDFFLLALVLLKFNMFTSFFGVGKLFLGLFMV